MIFEEINLVAFFPSLISSYPHSVLSKYIRSCGKIILIELPVLGESSILAYKAAMAAHIQNKYFEMHQRLIGHKGRINLDIIEVYAEEVGLNVKKLMNDINEIDTRYIEKNYSIADKLNINGTPTFLVGNEIVPGAISKSLMKELIISAYN